MKHILLIATMFTSLTSFALDCSVKNNDFFQTAQFLIKHVNLKSAGTIPDFSQTIKTTVITGDLMQAAGDAGESVAGIIICDETTNELKVMSYTGILPSGSSAAGTSGN